MRNLGLEAIGTAVVIGLGIFGCNLLSLTARYQPQLRLPKPTPEQLFGSVVVIIVLIVFLLGLLWLETRGGSSG